MSPRMRSAKVRVGLLITLGLIVVVVGGYWTTQLFEAAPNVADASKPEREYEVLCQSCDFHDTMTRTQINAIQRTDGMLLCPQCGKYTAYTERKNSPSVIMAPP